MHSTLEGCLLLIAICLTKCQALLGDVSMHVDNFIVTWQLVLIQPN